MRLSSSFLATCLAIAAWCLPLRAGTPFAKTIKGATDAQADNVRIHRIQTDSTGLSWVAGVAQGTADFGGGIRVDAAVQGTSFYQAFVARQDTKGQWVSASAAYGPWLGPQSTTPLSMVVNGIHVSGDDTYIVGSHANGGAVFNTAFLVKLDKLGNVVWTRLFTGVVATLNAVTTDPSGTLFVAGDFRTTPSLPNITLMGSSSRDIATILSTFQIVQDQNAFVLRLDPSGNLLSRSSAGSEYGMDSAVAVVADAVKVSVLLNLSSSRDFRPRVNVNGAQASSQNLDISRFDGTNVYLATVQFDGRWGRNMSLRTERDLGGFSPGTNGVSGDVTTEVLGRDLQLIGGKLYIAGSYRMAVTAQASTDPQLVGKLTDRLDRGGFLLRLRADDYQADGAVTYFRAPNENTNAYPVQLRGSDGQLFVTGIMPTTLQVYTETNNTNALTSIDAELTSASPNLFLGRFDAAGNPTWLRTTSRSSEVSPPSTFGAGALSLDSANNRLYWGGNFETDGNQKLVLGESPDFVSLLSDTTPEPINWGWLTAVDLDGKSLSQVTLRVESTYSPIIVNETSVTAPVEISMFRGAVIDLRARSSETTNTRRVVAGYTLNNVPATASGDDVRLTLNEDTLLEFLWKTQYALTVTSDHAIAGLPAATSAGNPDPLIGTHWMDEGTRVHPTINGVVTAQDGAGFGSRYVLKTFAVSSAAGTSTTQVNGATDVRVPDIVMSAPASLAYSWKRQFSVTVAHTLDTQRNLLVARQLDAFNNEVAGTRYTGNGAELWFDSGTKVEIGALRADDAVSLRGWRFASPVAPGYFPETSYSVSNPLLPDDIELSSRLLSKTIGTDTFNQYRTKVITALGRPVSITWDFGDTLYLVHAGIGEPIVFPTTMPTPTAEKWNNLTLASGPAGSAPGDMVAWDDVAKKALPLRPGVTFVEWKRPGGGKIMMQLVAGFAGDRWQDDATKTYGGPAYYSHVAATPPVELDPSASDDRRFAGVVYSEGDGAVAGTRFSAKIPGRTVLIFTKNANGTAQGDLTRETLEVRVVNTTTWNANLAEFAFTAQTATIGSKLTSPYDTAGLGTGYVVHELANYNANIYDRQSVSGPIIPVNAINGGLLPTDRDLVVVWYAKQDGIVWPTKPVFYRTFNWPQGPRIVISSRLGSEGLDTAGKEQLVFDPLGYRDVQIYAQPDRNKPGFNPNEEHARIYPSLHQSLKGKSVPAAFALRDDLNVTQTVIAAKPMTLAAKDYTSDPYVLVQYFDIVANEPAMNVYAVQREDSQVNDPRLLELPGAMGSAYRFQYSMKAGERISAPYPLNLVMGLSPCINTVERVFDSRDNIPNGTYFDGGSPSRRPWFIDHNQGMWAVAGDADFDGRFFYRIAPDFYFPFAFDSINSVSKVGDCVAFLTNFRPADGRLGVFDTAPRDFAEPIPVKFRVEWPDNPAVLKVGETLTYAGGENKADNPDAPGLPGVVGFASGQIVFDSANPNLDPSSLLQNYLARVISPLEERLIAYPTKDLPNHLKNPAGPDITVEGDTWYFNDLPPSLKKRVFFKPLAKLNSGGEPGVLGIRGFLNDRTLGASDLTASPPPVYVLEPNVLTGGDLKTLQAAGRKDALWDTKVGELYRLSRNPANLPGTAYNAGLQADPKNPSVAQPLVGLGPGLALVTNPALLEPVNPVGSGYITLAENNHESLGDAPVTLHVIRVDRDQKYRGAIKTLLPSNVFDEKITLRHTADFGGNLDAVAFDWWYHEEDGTVKVGDVPNGSNGTSPVWSPFQSSDGLPTPNQIDLQGNPALLLADYLFFTRYRFARSASTGSHLSDWAGAANSSPRDLDGDSRPDYRGQLATGWVKRVLDAVNPYEARIRDFSRTTSPATGASLLQNLGAPFVGPVALNASKDVVENLGLIELYETVLKRARDLSIDASQPVKTSGIGAAILLASSRLADFYTMLGHEAWDDALDPTLGFGAGILDPGNLNGTRFCFENQLPTLLDEELALLRGVDQNFGRPVFNRLFWNFTKGEGEVAYAVNYQIKDVNQDGFLDENDAMRLYPMGHGDAWGHYLSAMRKRYDLLNSPMFDWETRSEFYNLLDVVIGVDFADERNFARTAAARARVGAEIVNLTFRSRYSESGNLQLEGYPDTNPDRAWGVSEWARRSGQAAYLDWVTANSLLPAPDPNGTKEGIERIDRSTVTDLSDIATQLAGIQGTVDSANAGLNSLGLDPNVLPFDIDPTHIDVGSTAQIGRVAVQGLSHFEQINERAFEALRNADTALRYANDQKAKNRQVAQSSESLRKQAVSQDLEYRNRLIEIFGTPYSGQIGAGRAYPAGYNGPDINLFMYVDVNALNAATAPTANNVTYFDECVDFYSLAADVPSEFATDIQSHFLDDISLQGNTAVEVLGDNFLHLKLPATAADYSFVAPESWGQRASPGRLQTMVSDMLQTQAALSVAVIDYDTLIKQIRDRVALLKLRADTSELNLSQKQSLYDAINEANNAITGYQAAADTAAAGADLLHDIADGTIEGMPKLVGALAFDGFFLPRLVVKVSSTPLYIGLRIASLGFDQLAGVEERSKELLSLLNEIAIDQNEATVELRGMLYDIEELLINEGVIRVRVFGIREQLRGQLDQYRATLQQGLRLLEERQGANIRLAADTQENRYHDMLFRSGRHESISRYRALFDLAQRYCYMAAKAYDYETNFDPKDKASARPLLEQIAKARTLGVLTDTYPMAGTGLAGIMARLADNFRAIEGRLGFNNFQYDTTEFSLAFEQARISDAQTWKNHLYTHSWEDLWDVPEFRQFCRPFAPRGIPQPGIVLYFGTEVTAGKNFFGKDLGPGDSAYDPTLFATKIRAAGIRFVGYPEAALARTPYVYLIPAGIDYMTIPNSSKLETREWRVIDQVIPVPHRASGVDFGRPDWLASVDTILIQPNEQRRYSSFRASYGDDELQLNVTRFIGRSVWNSKWILIIPGQLLDSNAQRGINTFIENVTDIKLSFETYGYSGN